MDDASLIKIIGGVITCSLKFSVRLYETFFCFFQKLWIMNLRKTFLNGREIFVVLGIRYPLHIFSACLQEVRLDFFWSVEVSEYALLLDVSINFQEFSRTPENFLVEDPHIPQRLPRAFVPPLFKSRFTPLIGIHILLMSNDSLPNICNDFERLR